jgi:hypothetical protein
MAPPAIAVLLYQVSGGGGLRRASYEVGRETAIGTSPAQLGIIPEHCGEVSCLQKTACMENLFTAAFRRIYLRKFLVGIRN